MKLSRRAFLIGSGVVGAGLLVGLSLKDQAPIPNTREGSFQPNAWLQILPNGEVIFQCDRAEMGQGTLTGLAQIVGEELDFDPSRLTCEFAGAHPAFKNPALQLQLTGGSTSIMLGFEPLRHAAATARAMLVAAAAKKFGVAVADVTTENGVAKAGSQQATYGELADLAAQEKVPETVALKEPKDFRYVGKSIQRLDSQAKIEGRAQFGVDVQLPNQKVAVIVRCPHFGGSLKSFDNSVEKLPGVVKAFAIHSGVAIVADGYWPARSAAEKLNVQWDKGPLAGLDTKAIMAGYQKALDETEKPFSLDENGKAAEVLANAKRIVKAEYTAPFTHHSPMEPQNGTALFNEGKLELWLSTQTADIARAVAAHYSGVAIDDITVNSTFLGGGFGRRGYVDFAGEAAAVAVQMPGVPVKVMWSREDDMQHDYYRPPAIHRFEAALPESGVPEAWQHRFVSTSIMSDFFADMMGALLPKWVPTKLARSMGNGIGGTVANYDVTMGEGVVIPYAIENRDIGMVHYDSGVPCGFWRSVAHSTNAFAVESFVDELAFEAEADPVDFRRQLLKDKPRHLAALELAVKEANWPVQPRIAGFGRGIAVHESFGSVVAIVADVLVQGNEFRVTRLVVAADCGSVINPDQVAAQLEGGALYALTAAVKPGVEFADGACAQSNFHDLPVIRINEIPEIITAVVPSTDKPTGVGEIAVPPTAPAIANAIFAASRKRLRDLPLKLS